MSAASRSCFAAFGKDAGGRVSWEGMTAISPLLAQPWAGEAGSPVPGGRSEVSGPGLAWHTSEMPPSTPMATPRLVRFKTWGLGPIYSRCLPETFRLERSARQTWPPLRETGSLPPLIMRGRLGKKTVSCVCAAHTHTVCTASPAHTAG